MFFSFLFCGFHCVIHLVMILNTHSLCSCRTPVTWRSLSSRLSSPVTPADLAGGAGKNSGALLSSVVPMRVLHIEHV